MRLGVMLPSTTPGGSTCTGETLVTQARTIERLGFTSLWCFDAIGRGAIPPDHLIAVAVAATATARICAVTWPASARDTRNTAGFPCHRPR